MAATKKGKDIKVKTWNKIGRCNCEHEYQDQRYGKYNRVMNFSIGKDKFRCTACGEIRD